MNLKSAAAAALAAATILTAGTAHAETAAPQEAATYTPTADGAGLEISLVDGTHFAQSHNAIEVLDAAGTEALGGAAVGSAVPGIGTATGAVVGGVAGALTGAAAAC